MFWGCFSYGLGLLNEMTINMNQEVYLNILNDRVLPFSQYLHDKYVIDNRIFQNDICRVHWAR